MFGLTVLLAGCFPASHTIYKPEVPGGRLSAASCHGGSGPNEVATFDHAGISVEVVARTAGIDGHGQVTVTFMIPEGVTFMLRSGNFELASGERERVTLPIEYLTTYFPKHTLVPLHTKVSGRTAVRGVLRFYARYQAFLRPTKPLGPRFTLMLPAALVNDIEVNFPAILFIETTEFAIHALNC